MAKLVNVLGLGALAYGIWQAVAALRTTPAEAADDRGFQQIDAPGAIFTTGPSSLGWKPGYVGDARIGRYVPPAVGGGVVDPQPGPVFFLGEPTVAIPPPEPVPVPIEVRPVDSEPQWQVVPGGAQVKHTGSRTSIRTPGGQNLTPAQAGQLNQVRRALKDAGKFADMLARNQAILDAARQGISTGGQELSPLDLERNVRAAEKNIAELSRELAGHKSVLTSSPRWMLQLEEYLTGRQSPF